MTRVLRGAAVIIAILAMWDPGVRLTRRQPLPVDVRALPSPADPRGERAERLRGALLARLGDAIAARREDPAALVVVGGALDEVPADVPVSTLSITSGGRNVHVLGTRASERVLPGQQVSIQVELAAVGSNGTTSAVILQRNGLEIARTQHAWNADVANVSLEVPFVAAEPGVHVLRVTAEPIAGEVTTEDNIRDVAIRVEATPLRVLAWEPRPSWAAAFIRRALEEDPAFSVSAVARPARGRETRTGEPPARLSTETLATYDAVVVGAPDELSSRDVEALVNYLSIRGGAVLLVPDRAESEAYERLLPGKLQYVVLDRATPLAAISELRASELLTPAKEWPNARVLAHAEGQRRPAITATPRGRGIVIFSGALDAWKFRGGSDLYARFWRGLIAGAALGTPRQASVTVEPAIAAPGDPLLVRLTLTPAETAPTVSAMLTSSHTGAETPIRLWPAARAGEYVGELTAPDTAGGFNIRAKADGRTVDTTLVVDEEARSAQLENAAALLPALTGGVAAQPDELSKIEQHLRARVAPVQPVTVHPMRSPWWVLGFAGALCAEWTIRRRKGLR